MRPALRSSCRSAVWALLACGLVGCSGDAGPHIVVFLADDLGWQDVGYHNKHIKTPHIDELAKTGAQLDQFYVLPVCTPTRAAFLTGRYPMRTGLQKSVVRPWSKFGLPTDERTLAQALRDAGYTTAICGKWHLGHAELAQLPTRRGFDHQYGHYCGAIDYFTHERNGARDWNRGDRPLDEEGYSTDLIANECVGLIGKHDPSVPLFLYVPFNAPHTPLQATEPYLQKYEKAAIDEDRRKLAAMVTCMDDAIGRVLAALEARGMRDDTLVVFMSDNGGALGSKNKPLRNFKGSLYEGGVRVPAVVHWPGKIEPDQKIEGMMHVVDLFPTLVGLAGGTTEGCKKPLDGMDVWATIAAGKPSPRRELLYNVTDQSGAIRYNAAVSETIGSDTIPPGHWKLVWNPSGKPPGGRKKARFQLFDLAVDAPEAHNVARANPAVVAALRKKLEGYARQAVPAFDGPWQLPEGFHVPERWGPPGR